MKKFRMSMERKHILEGYIFVSPFIIGFLLFFAFPLFLSIWLSFGKVVKMQGFDISWVGLDNYMRAFLIDATFVPMFLNTVKLTLQRVPLIIVFSLILAVLINKKIKFKGTFRVIYFLPFLLGTGYLMQQLLNQGTGSQVLSISSGNLVPKEFLSYMGPTVSSAIEQFLKTIVLVLWASGVQIVLFLSGLQGISHSLYESAQVDGATENVMFWKITIPMISPIMLLNIVYTVIDSFTNISNPILNYIQTQAFKNRKFEYASAVGWIYFLFITVLVLLVFAIMQNYIYQANVKGGKKDERKAR